MSLLIQICSHIEVTYLKLRTGNYNNLREEYLRSLYRFNEKALYRQNGEIIEGKITDVSDSGFLSMETAAGVMTYNFKEIEFINQPK
jgi:BirA family biotin operon repressor/biotin-[acetyl-CoA-carboxylase] ligase